MAKKSDKNMSKTENQKSPTSAKKPEVKKDILETITMFASQVAIEKYKEEAEKKQAEEQGQQTA